jgi:hypothetical protein
MGAYYYGWTERLSESVNNTRDRHLNEYKTFDVNDKLHILIC